MSPRSLAIPKWYQHASRTHGWPPSPVTAVFSCSEMALELLVRRSVTIRMGILINFQLLAWSRVKVDRSGIAMLKQPQRYLFDYESIDEFDGSKKD